MLWPFGLRPSAGGAVLLRRMLWPFGLRPSAGGAVLLRGGAFTALAMGLFAALPALARVGGGHAYSGGSHSSHGGGGFSGGGGGGNGGLFYLLIELVFAYPEVGVPVAALVLLGLVVAKSSGGGQAGGWLAQALGGDPGRDPSDGDPAADLAAARVDLNDRAGGEPSAANGEPSAARPRRELASLRTVDPSFSVVLFEDFLYALYAEIQKARAAGELPAWAPYVAPQAMTTLDALPRPAKIDGIIVAGLHFLGVDGVAQASPRIQVRVRFETNYRETDAAGRSTAYYCAEIWSLSRSRAARSRPPDKTRIFACPSCGAALAAVQSGRCSYCGAMVAAGDLDWAVYDVALLEREAREPVLFAPPQPPGFERPTRMDDDLQDRLAELEARDAAFSFPAFRARLELIFQ